MEQPQKEPNPQLLPYPPQLSDDEIDVRELFTVLWKGKWLIFVITMVFSLGAVFYSLSLPNIYKADALLAPADSSSGGGLSKMAGQLGGLAALAGVNLGGNESSQTDLAVQVMKSRHFIESFIDSHDLLIPLMAAKDWDLKNNLLIIDEDIYDSSKQKWLRKAEGLRGAKPSLQEAVKVFNEDVLTITNDKESGLYTVAISHFSPYIAQQWVSWLVEDINRIMRERAIKETSQNLTYLNHQLEKTSVADMQTTFYKLIEEQTKALMLAEVQEEFVFKTLDPAVVPEMKSAPRRALICFLGAFLGCIIGVTIALVYYLPKKNNEH
ncbi:LPS O-antigen length regulator [Vibrio owensii]|uniref:Wzz/FepE/Etk N-terminal domain-containing protein n=1 Tax=Vibrio owensii TaxID=696485 RepID=UPI000EFD0726|nr:Wzz/FepE/Etk N-terminal domain-containing protein [Vibrio owensii]AYO21209.1 LPS O-antigen length regulator [Vibrio owensii]